MESNIILIEQRDLKAKRYIVRNIMVNDKFNAKGKRAIDGILRSCRKNDFS